MNFNKRNLSTYYNNFEGNLFKRKLELDWEKNEIIINKFERTRNN